MNMAERFTGFDRSVTGVMMIRALRDAGHKLSIDDDDEGVYFFAEFGDGSCITLRVSIGTITWDTE